MGIEDAPIAVGGLQTHDGAIAALESHNGEEVVVQKTETNRHKRKNLTLDFLCGVCYLTKTTNRVMADGPPAALFHLIFGGCQ